jgi:hypothetical protein
MEKINHEFLCIEFIIVKSESLITDRMVQMKSTIGGEFFCVL